MPQDGFRVFMLSVNTCIEAISSMLSLCSSRRLQVVIPTSSDVHSRAVEYCVKLDSSGEDVSWMSKLLNRPDIGAPFLGKQQGAGPAQRMIINCETRCYPVI